MKRVSDILPTLTPDKVAELYGKLGDPSAQRNEVVAAIMKVKNVSEDEAQNIFDFNLSMVSQMESDLDSRK
ncbi:hypothetical protein [Leptospira noguchii]|uniref:Uncharacterized protein n=1 Tax=Leptospira noguchii serovar Panama str. CZ214 TaxID=1001595 RepID=T0FQA9_9LEPT|nr:hypothetical protein [Leptospira noguchii]EQA69537.1 hypothetical protein LEP1GSC059_2358 [Leptospira noguchii serovar Panama str. CZ214]EQA70277.1 hypothetical protein LEP1GSC059_0704 [Leptospira noguchii serovar Panama str. CZ214]EQA72389.1 hypothetical protein LEP1GSC059_3669 [Leptospira noguchii serovar Panama str. CZ214]EQA72475.1 hypothetical protein LEP1GSC059_3199 [Leptospira noguchii serovar Panama str. CZ214]